MIATTKVYLFVCFLVLVIGVYFQRVPREDYDWVYFQGVSSEAYDDFLLALQWPPSFCNTVKQKCREDVMKDFVNFTIHGLWPRKNGISINICKSGPLFNYEKLKENELLIKRMNIYWPNLIKAKRDDEFWSYEWKKHGRCIGLDQNDYFDKACSMKENANLEEKFATQGIHPGESYSSEEYKKAIKNSTTLDVIPELQCNCNDKQVKQLLEVRLCVHKNKNEFLNCSFNEGKCQGSPKIEFPKWD